MPGAPTHWSRAAWAANGSFRVDLSSYPAPRRVAGIGATWPFTTGSVKVGNPYPQQPF